jgi:selenide,water dikinase
MKNAQSRKQLVLVGGGHAHVFVLEAFALKPMTDVDITLVTKEPMAPYSGMLPGFVAGHYALSECLIDLHRLCNKACVRLVEGTAIGIDRERRRLKLIGGAGIPYDVLSLDVGITPDVSDIAGALDHALLVKPVSQFAPKWQELLARAEAPDGPRHLAVVGGGAAGVELVLAARNRLTATQTWQMRRHDPFRYTLIAGTGVLPGYPQRAQRLVGAALAKSEIDVIENDAAVAIHPGQLRLRSGREIACDAAIVSTKAKAPEWFSGTGLARDKDGYLALRPTLQTLSDEDIFAAGDCATVIEHPRPKAGVFAVRQGPVLAHYLRRHLMTGLLDPYVPQRAFLTLISLGDKSAVASRGSFAAAGHWAWIWKDWIDRRFMARFNRP